MDVDNYDSESDVEDDFDSEEGSDNSPHSPWAPPVAILQVARHCVLRIGYMGLNLHSPSNVGMVDPFMRQKLI